MLDKAGRYRGCLLGMAVGDALGAPIEGRPRGSFDPVMDMEGEGPFGLPRGTWTDDTSMALCLGESLLEKDGFDPADQMRRYLKWLDEGYMSCASAGFGLGLTVSAALESFRHRGEPYSGPTSPRTAGNGCIMRFAPVALHYFPDREQIMKYSAESSRTTHGTQECLDACRLMGEILFRILSGAPKSDCLFGGIPDEIVSPSIRGIAHGAYAGKSADDIRGSGYVVESLEASLWCFHMTDSLRNALLLAVNLGDDADTTGAICGQIAGAYYGESAIPADWLGCLEWPDPIVSLADRLVAR
jgi:ADP-ribosyl-[dinitrogen reductase] hydrolase